MAMTTVPCVHTEGSRWVWLGLPTQSSQWILGHDGRHRPLLLLAFENWCSHSSVARTLNHNLVSLCSEHSASTNGGHLSTGKLLGCGGARFHSSTQELEAGGSLCFRSAWFTALRSAESEAH